MSKFQRRQSMMEEESNPRQNPSQTGAGSAPGVPGSLSPARENFPNVNLGNVSTDRRISRSWRDEEGGHDDGRSVLGKALQIAALHGFWLDMLRCHSSDNRATVRRFESKAAVFAEPEFIPEVHFRFRDLNSVDPGSVLAAKVFDRPFPVRRSEKLAVVSRHSLRRGSLPWRG